jgi:hypothetical protein
MGFVNISHHYLKIYVPPTLSKDLLHVACLTLREGEASMHMYQEKPVLGTYTKNTRWQGIKAKQVLREVRLPAISEEDLPDLLKRLEIYEEVLAGRYHCYICGKTLSLDTIGAVGILNGKPILVCDNPACIGKASKLFSRRQYNQSPPQESSD